MKVFRASQKQLVRQADSKGHRINIWVNVTAAPVGLIQDLEAARVPDQGVRQVRDARALPLPEHLDEVRSDAKQKGRTRVVAATALVLPGHVRDKPKYCVIFRLEDGQCRTLLVAELVECL